MKWIQIEEDTEIKEDLNKQEFKKMCAKMKKKSMMSGKITMMNKPKDFKEMVIDFPIGGMRM